MRDSIDANVEDASGVANPCIFESHVNNLVFYNGSVVFVGSDELEDVRASWIAIADMTCWGLTMTVYVVRLVTRTVNTAIPCFLRIGFDWGIPSPNLVIANHWPSPVIASLG